MVCNCVENIITKKDGCNKKDIVIEVIKTVFNLNDVEIKSLGATIECFWSNNMIVKMKSVEKVGKIMVGFAESFFKIIIITSVKQIINYLIEKMLMKIGISELVMTIIIFLI